MKAGRIFVIVLFLFALLAFIGGLWMPPRYVQAVHCEYDACVYDQCQDAETPTGCDAKSGGGCETYSCGVVAWE
ncbi:MAG: hypothetical protein Q9M35_00145 [Rhodothermus sp.]|nr:hypothetical protein [Rhodothermus sp.]